MPFEDQPRRRYFEGFRRAVTNVSLRRAVVLMGPRRVGKTVMVYHAVRNLLDEGVSGKNILYASLETPVYTGVPLEKLYRMFLAHLEHERGSECYVFFDEIQYLPDWEVHLKSLVDSFPKTKFVATGSAAAALRLKSAESGAGRFSNYVLPPLTFAEYLSFIGRDTELVQIEEKDEEYPLKHYRAIDIDELNREFVHYLNFGGYPEAVFSETVRSDPAQYIKSDIIDKVLLRDLPSLYGISDIQELNRLFTTLAYNTSNEVSYEGLSQSSGVAKNTLKRYLEYLEAAFLIRRVPRIDNNARRYKRERAFKVYLTNPSMRCALFGKSDSESAAMGPLTETAVYSQWQHSRQTDLYYARWKKGELDLVCLNVNEQLPKWAVEVKWSDHHVTSREQLDAAVDFAARNPSLTQPILMTTRSVDQDAVEYRGTAFKFRPSALYVYLLGNNLLSNLQLADADTPISE